MSVTAPSLYLARVMHLRLLPRGERTHQFRYSVFRLWLDIDRIAETLAPLRLIGHNRFNLCGFYERDHGARDGTPLRSWVEALLATEGVPAPAKIMLYCFPRMLGYEFNPLAMYCAYDESGKLIGVVYQVRNTDGDLCPYVANIRRDGLRHSSEKTFYVSPFIDGDQRYGFTLNPTNETLALRIRVDGKHGLTMIATETAESRPFTNATLSKFLLLRSFTSFKITVGIYFEAVRLRLKGARFYKHPGNDGRYQSNSNNQPSGTNAKAANLETKV